MIRRAVNLFGGVATLLMVACSSNVGLHSFEGLEPRLTDYYSLEQRGDWSTAYEYRTKAFRRSVSKKLYLAQMQKDNTGWHLVKYKIDSISERDGRVRLKITFTETPPAGFLEGRLPPGREPTVMDTEDESIWVKEDGTWYAYAAGTRGRLSLNAAVVP